MYHVELRQFPHTARVFNLELEEVHRRFVGPWVAGEMIEYDDRRWPPERSRLTILEGPALGSDEIGLGRGWANVSRRCRDVTDPIIADAKRGARARPELEALKDAISEVAPTQIRFTDVMALAAAAQPLWRASEQLALAEEAVWEMLHHERLAMVRDGRRVARDDWQTVVLSWETWAGTGPDNVGLRAARPDRPDAPGV